MIALYILLGIVILFTGLLCVPVVLQAEYAQALTLRVRWAFLKIPVIPGKEKKPKKKKKDKPEKEKPEKKPKEKSDEPNILQRFYTYQGIHGFIDLLGRTIAILKQFRHGLWLCFRIRKLSLHMRIIGGDPQSTVEKYGKTCAAVFPALGWLSSHLRSKPGGVRAQISPDFTGLAEKEMAFAAEISIIPLVLIHALIMLLLRLGIRVALKFLSGAKPPKAAQAKTKQPT